VSEATSVRHDANAVMLDRLRQVAGDDAVLSPDELPDFDVAGVVPRAMVAPDSVDAAARTLALCAAERWPVEPAGGATWLGAGAPPAIPPVVITTVRLQRIFEYEPANLVVGVEAGMPLDALAAQLAAERQAIPLDPPAAPGATIGAAVALASAGPLRAAHGTPRDMVIGVEFVAGDGRVLRFGGRVVKNVAGYDFVRLLTGSRGIFGLLTGCFIRLRGAPEFDTSVVTGARTAGDALAVAAEIRRLMTPDALEVLGPALSAHVLAGTIAAGQWAVLIRLRGSEAAVAEAVERLGGVTPQSAERLTDEVARHVWQTAREAESDARLCVRLADLPGRLPATVAAAERLISQSRSELGPQSGWPLAVHAADGIVRAWLASPPDEYSLARLSEILPALASKLASTGGTVSWPVWPTDPDAPRPALPGSSADTRLRLLAQIRARFDPAGILSPGRHVVEI
jgi:glycolate oxidase FAD binding subunit